MRKWNKGTIGGGAMLALALFASRGNAAATIVIQNDDEGDKGFNDPTPAASVGGNPGTTRGAQALAAFQEAASIWSKAIDSPVPIRISAKFAPLPCTKTNGVIGSASPHRVVKDSQGAKPGVLYPVALASRLAGMDLFPKEPAIDAVFNGAAGTSGCLEGHAWYLGLDALNGDQTDLVTTVIHEIAHGLGMTTFVDLPSGALYQQAPDVYSLNLLDERTGKLWGNMTDTERAASARGFHQLSWAGENVTAAARGLLDRGMPTLTFGGALDQLHPAIAVAAFGPPLTTTPIEGALSAVDDGTASPTDACEKPASLAGKVAFIEAGGCADAVKVTMAQSAGAVAAILVSDSANEEPLAPNGGDATGVAIPSVRINQRDAGVIRPVLGQAPMATLLVDMTRGIGTSAAGRVLLDATDPVKVGVSVTHWEPMVSPHLLMQATQATAHSLDLTPALMEDLGWRPYHCGDGIAEGTEQCDDGPDGGADCSSMCTRTSGTGTVGAGGTGGSGGSGGATEVDGGDSGLRDAGLDAPEEPDGYDPSKPPPPNRYLDAAFIDAPAGGIQWVPKSGGCGCRVGGETRGSSGTGFIGAALLSMVLLGRRRR